VRAWGAGGPGCRGASLDFHQLCIGKLCNKNFANIANIVGSLGLFVETGMADWGCYTVHVSDVDSFSIM
jgi:hypothetical protein